VRRAERARGVFIAGGTRGWARGGGVAIRGRWSLERRIGDGRVPVRGSGRGGSVTWRGCGADPRDAVFAFFDWSAGAMADRLRGVCVFLLEKITYVAKKKVALPSNVWYFKIKKH
jgi:hypothetical protein